MRPRQAAAIALPNGFTLANLFFGIFAIVAASRGDFDAAARFIVFGAIADALDGRIARATNSGSRFGEELDSLVDAISFGTAPALIMYFAVFQSTRWEWIFCFFFTACAVMRLARFNVMQAGRKTTHFQGLPSPAAGGILATYYWFSQTPLYTETVVADLPWHQLLRFLMLGLGMLMISNVQYAKFPVVNFRTLQGVLGFLLVVSTLIGVIFLPKQFFFPAGMAYVLYGIGRTVFLGLLDRLPGREDGPDADEEDEFDAPASPRRRRRRRRSPRNPSGPETGREDSSA
jgi:CDP-diacylglycerol--serine O-phosphatidyltransferase